MEDYAEMNPNAVAAQSSYDRSLFIQRTYTHLAVAILAFAGLLAALLSTPIAVNLARGIMQNWILVIIAWMVASYVAERWAQADMPQHMQYLGLGLFIVLEAVIFLPLMVIASIKAPQAIPAAGITTLAIFAALTFIAFTSKKDFTFLGGVMQLGMFVVLGMIIASFFMPINIVLLSSVIVGLCGVCILYNTSGILYHYHPDQYVAAALGLFASIATMFYHILILFMMGGEE